MGQNNQRRGKSFEKLAAGRAEALGLTRLVVKWIDRTLCRGTSKTDVEIIQYPDITIDCKFTEGKYTFSEMEKLLVQTIGKYGDCSVCVFGQKFGGTRINPKDIIVAGMMPTPYGQYLHMMQYDSWLHLLDSMLI